MVTSISVLKKYPQQNPFEPKQAEPEGKREGGEWWMVGREA